MAKSEERLSLLSEIASMYYIRSMSQEEIAKRTFLSRPRISRLLKQAHDEGIVEIKIKYFSERNSYDEKALQTQFGLKEVRVYNCMNCTDEEIHNTICRYSALCVDEMLRQGMVVGITRGSIIAGMINFLNNPRELNLKVVQMMGAEARDSLKVIAPDLIRKIVDLYGGSAIHINAPLYVENDFVRNELQKEPMLHKELLTAQSADLVVTSVRRLYKDMENHVWAGFIDNDTLNEIVDAGGVGYVLGRAFDIDGNLVDHPVNRRIISVNMEALKRKSVVAIAYGKSHGRAVLGALRGGYIKTLITDQGCAEEILEINQ